MTLNNNEGEDENDDSAFIAKRTRTKLSLVDIPIDSLEKLLPDTIETVRNYLKSRTIQFTDAIHRQAT
jgi:hypothetical protein